MQSHQRLEWIKRLVHGPRHGPQQNDPKIGVVEREEVVAGNRDENSAPSYRVLSARLHEMIYFWWYRQL